MRLETITLIDSVGVRPEGSCGNVGWSPRAWVMAFILPNETAEQAFLRVNPNWRDENVKS